MNVNFDHLLNAKSLFTKLVQWYQKYVEINKLIFRNSCVNQRSLEK